MDPGAVQGLLLKQKLGSSLKTVSLNEPERMRHQHASLGEFDK